MENLNVTSTDRLDQDIDKLIKSLYMESSDIWEELTDKINNRVFDEMVLFFATKYDCINIIKYSVENNFINLNSPSENHNFPNILRHLISVSIQNNVGSIYQYLNKFAAEFEDIQPVKTMNNQQKNMNKNNNKNGENTMAPKKVTPNNNAMQQEINDTQKPESNNSYKKPKNTFNRKTKVKVKNNAPTQSKLESNYEALYNSFENEQQEEEASELSRYQIDIIEEKPIDNRKLKNNDSMPEYICPHCNCNIFEQGYNLCETIMYKYSESERKPMEVSRQLLKSVMCSNCNTIIDNLSAEKLGSIYRIKNCNKCGTDLTTCGIVDKSLMGFDEKKQIFQKKQITYHCANCDELLTPEQEEYLGL